ncbi:hypothetical protein DYB26_006265 [Aphanomyces astaci]|uniref:RGS domain-containing protein n=1 Tax=Aphanomyces astaci TaxID=112090 RepID=A0A396ZVP1_APHAT|nr:hypothetical protein DYB36_008701 [Aphanomyces astaci]RHY54688.1 hypothetical protein DYB38_006308 [Aphanomyces astaci]RHY58857.1 hypothetical protein DYB34_003820 [Aphanomyces astaci]RHY80765.1 hypothetical protein DYB26_006265 [Aphanomyces astaci]
MEISHLVVRVSYLLMQCSVVISFQITELLAQPKLATAESVHRTMQRRWFLHRKVQSAVFVLTNAFVLGPIYYPFAAHFDVLVTHTRGACFDETSWDILLAEIGLIGALSFALAIHVSRVVDNFGLRRAFLATSKAGILCMALQFLLSIGTYKLQWTWLDDFYVLDSTASLPFHAFFYFNLLHPLKTVLRPSTFHQRVMVLSDPFSQHRAHSTSHFKAFLLHPDGFRAFLEFCRLELRLELLLAWQMLTQFEAAPTSRAAIHVFETCFEPHCMYATDIGASWRPHFAPHRLTWTHHTTVFLSPSLFCHVTAALLQRMYDVQFPRFLQHPRGVLAWHEFLDRKRAVEKLDQVLTMVNRQGSSTSSFQMKLHLPLHFNGG